MPKAALRVPLVLVLAAMAPRAHAYVFPVGPAGSGIGSYVSVTFSGTLIAPGRTVIDGRSLGRTLFIPGISSGMVTFDNLTIRNGRVRAGGTFGVGQGAGIFCNLTGGGQLVLQRVHVLFNQIRADLSGPAEAQGAGAYVLMQNSARLVIDRTRFEDNTIYQSGSALSALGGGLHLQVFGGSAAVRSSVFLRNFGNGSVTTRGGGLYALVQDVAGRALELEDTQFQTNQVPLQDGVGAGAAVWASGGDGSATIAVRRCRFVGNSSGRTQLQTTAVQGARIDVSDTLVAAGRGGLSAFANRGHTYLTNLTVANNQRRGIDGQALDGTLAVFNSIVFGNLESDLALTGEVVTSASNLVGVDPLCVDPEAGNYRVDGASEAVDAGFPAPPGGLGPSDLARQPRVMNGRVDIGAYERRP